MRRIRTRLGVLAVAATLLLAGCNGLIDQQATYTTTGTQTITGTAPTRSGDPLTAVTVNGVGATLNGQQYSAVIPLDGTAVFNRVLVVASYLSGFTATERSTVAYADGTHATVVAPSSPVVGGGGARLTPAGFAKLLPDVASALVLDKTVLNYPATTACGILCNVTQAAPPTIGAPGSGPSLALTNPASLALEMTLPTVQEYLDVQTIAGTCVLVVSYSQVKAYGTFQVGPGGTSAGGLRVRPNAPFGTVLLGTRTTSGCGTLNGSLITSVVGTVDSLLTGAVPNMLNEPDVSVGSAPYPTPVSKALEAVLSPLNAASATPFDGVSSTSPLSSAVTDASGAFLSTDAHAVASGPATGAPLQADSLGFGAPVAAAPGSTGAFGLGFDLGVGESFTALNQVLAAVTERGALNHVVTASGGTPLTYNGLDTLVGLGGPLATDRPVQLVVTPELAPAVTTGAAQTEGGFARLHVGGLRVTAQYADTKGTFLEFVVDFDTDPYLVVDSGMAMLALTAPQVADEHLDVVRRAASVPLGAGASTFTHLQDEVLGALHTGVPVFALPSVAGHSLSEVSSGRVGDGAYLFLAIS